LETARSQSNRLREETIAIQQTMIAEASSQRSQQRKLLEDLDAMRFSRESEEAKQRSDRQKLQEDLDKLRQSKDVEVLDLRAKLQADGDRLEHERKDRCQLQEDLLSLRQKIFEEATLHSRTLDDHARSLEMERLHVQKLQEELLAAKAEAEASRLSYSPDSPSVTALELAEERFKSETALAESRQEVSQLRAEIMRSGSAVKVTNGLRTRYQSDGTETNGTNGTPDSHMTFSQASAGRQRMLALALNSAGAVAALLQQVRKLGDAHHMLVERGSQSRGSLKSIAATPAQLRAVRALERQTGMLERTNHEWATSFGEELGFTNGSGEDRISPSSGGTADLTDEGEALTPAERGAALASVLRRTERRLERLHDRLESLTSSVNGAHSMSPARGQLFPSGENW